MSPARPAAPQELGSGRMFDRIARRYDLLNRVVSFGIDRRWRREVLRSLDVGPGSRVLDVATGTADLAILLGRTGAEVAGVDPSAGMLEIGRAKVRRAGLAGRVALREGIAEALPFGDGAFDAACIAFGIRNVPDRGVALREMRRVVEPGGRIAVLELCQPRGGLLAGLARVHVHAVVPRIGSLLSGDHEYRYLARSIAAFPPPETFRALMESCGWAAVRVRELTFGAACLFEAVNPAGAR